MRTTRVGPVCLALCTCWIFLAGQAPSFPSTAVLDEFLFPSEEDKSTAALRAAFHMDRIGAMITMAAKMGPANAAQVAATLPDREFQQAYRDLASYLDLFGPCQKQQSGGTEGWWSKYPDNPPEGQCTEATKLLASILLWNQTHYCRQLLTGEAKPKTMEPFTKGPPWRLDEPPVKSPWLNAETLYAMADAALKLQYQEGLRKHIAATADARIRQASLDAVAEMESEKPDRELLALALAKVLLRSYEAVHLRHWQERQSKSKK